MHLNNFDFIFIFAVSLGLRVSLSGPRELLNTQRLLLNKEVSCRHQNHEQYVCVNMTL